MSYRERAALARVADRPVPLGDMAPERVDPLIAHGLVKVALGHYLITPKGQLERQRQVFRAASQGKRAHVDGRRFLFLQEARFQGDSVPRSRIWEWLGAQGRRLAAYPATADQRTLTGPGVIGRLRAFVTDRAAAAPEPAADRPRAMAELLPAALFEESEAETASDPEADLFLPRAAQNR